MSRDVPTVLKQLRKDRALTQAQMAKLCDVSAAVISRAESEPDFRVGRDSLEKISAALELTSTARAELFRAAGVVDVLAAQIKEIAQLRAEVAELRAELLNRPGAAPRPRRRGPTP